MKKFDGGEFGPQLVNKLNAMIDHIVALEDHVYGSRRSPRS